MASLGQSSEDPGIALVISDLSGGGAQRVLTTLANAWHDHGRAVTVITLDDGSSDFFGLASGIRRVALGLTGASTSLWSAAFGNLRRVLVLRRAIRDSRAAAAISFVGTTNLVTILACKGLSARLIISERNDPLRQSLGFPWQALRRLLYRHADLVTANSHAAVAALGAFVPERRLRFVPNPLPKASGRSAPGRSAGGPPTILSAGRLTAQKGFDVLLTAFAASRARQSGWRLAILGEGELRSALVRQSAELGIEAQVELRGLHPDIQGQLLGAELFVLASRFEGTPNAVLDAMAAARSVIVTESCAGALEFVVDGETGQVVPTDDPAALAAAIDRLAEDPDLRRRQGQAGSMRVLSCQVERVLPVWDGLIDEVLDRGREAGTQLVPR